MWNFVSDDCFKIKFLQNHIFYNIELYLLYIAFFVCVFIQFAAIYNHKYYKMRINMKCIVSIYTINFQLIKLEIEIFVYTSC